MTYTRAQLRSFDKLARAAAGMPEVQTLAQLAGQHAEAAIQQIKDLATTCPIPEVRLKASQSLLELVKSGEGDEFGGNPVALEAMLRLPPEQRRAATLQLFANGEITKRDLDAIVGMLNGDQKAQLELLLATNQQLEKRLAEQAANKTIEGTARGNGTSMSVTRHGGELVQ